MNKNSEKRLIAEKTAIATTTFYKNGFVSDDLRMELAKRTVESAVESGYDVHVVDGGSPDYFIRDLEGYGARISFEKLPDF